MDFMDENKVLMWQYYIWELFIDKEVCVFLLKGDRKESREGIKKARERNRRQGQIMTARTTVALSVSAQPDGAGLLHTVVNLCGSCSGLVGFPNTSRLCLPSMGREQAAVAWLPGHLDSCPTSRWAVTHSPMADFSLLVICQAKPPWG